MPLIGCEEAVAMLEAENAPAMWIFDQQTLAFLYVNRAAVERYGYSKKEFLELTILDIRPVEDVPAVLRLTLDPGQRRATVERKHRHKTKDGDVFSVFITSWELTFHGRPAELVCALPLAIYDRAATAPEDLSAWESNPAAEGLD